MKLTELDPEWLRFESLIETWDVVDGEQSTWRERGCPTVKKTGPRETIKVVDSFVEAQGITFLCPICSKDGNTNCHALVVSFNDKGIGDGLGTRNSDNKQVHWNVSGDGFDNLSLTPSIHITSGCNWHGFVTNGIVT